MNTEETKTRRDLERKAVIPRAPVWKRAKFLLAYWLIGKPIAEEIKRAEDERNRLKELIREVINEDKS